MVVLDSTIVNVALPAMRRGLHLGAVELQWIVNAYLLTLGGLILLGGRLGDHYGRKRVYLIGGAIFTVASFAGGVAPSAAVLLGARAVQGVGAALLAPGTLSLLTSVYTEPRARTRALAVWNATAASGAALGVFLGGALTDGLGWRAVMFVNVPAGILVILLGRAALPESRRADRLGTRLDVPGALTVTAALTALVYGVVGTESSSWGSPRTLGVLGAAAALFAVAAVIESRTPHPLIPLTVLRRGGVAMAITMLLILGAVITATFYFQSLYLQQVRGYSPFGAGLLMLPFGVLVILTPLLAARLTMRYGPRIVALTTPVVAIGGILWMSRWSAHGSVVLDAVLPLVVVGLGISILFFSLSVLLTSEIEREHSGLGSGLLNAGRQIGGSIGLAVMTVIAASHTRSLLGAHHGPVAQATAAGYGFALVIEAALVGVGALVIAWHFVRWRTGVRTAAAPVEAQPPAVELV